MERVELARDGLQLTWGHGNATTLFARVDDTLEAGARAGKPQFIMRQIPSTDVS